MPSPPLGALGRLADTRPCPLGIFSVMMELQRLQVRERGVALRESAALQHMNRAAALDAQVSLLRAKIAELEARGAEVGGRGLASQLQEAEERAVRAEQELGEAKGKARDLERAVQVASAARNLAEGSLANMKAERDSARAACVSLRASQEGAPPASPSELGRLRKQAREHDGQLQHQTERLRLAQLQNTALADELSKTKKDLEANQRQGRAVHEHFQEFRESSAAGVAALEEELRHTRRECLERLEALQAEFSSDVRTPVNEAIALCREVRGVLGEKGALRAAAVQTDRTGSAEARDAEVERLRRELIDKRAEVERAQMLARHTSQQSAEKDRRVNLMEDMVELAALSRPTTPGPDAVRSRPGTARAGSRPSSAAPVRDLSSRPGSSGRKPQLGFNMYHVDWIDPSLDALGRPPPEPEQPARVPKAVTIQAGDVLPRTQPGDAEAAEVKSRRRTPVGASVSSTTEKKKVAKKEPAAAPAPSPTPAASKPKRPATASKMAPKAASKTATQKASKRAQGGEGAKRTVGETARVRRAPRSFPPPETRQRTPIAHKPTYHMDASSAAPASSAGSAVKHPQVRRSSVPGFGRVPTLAQARNLRQSACAQRTPERRAEEARQAARKAAGAGGGGYVPSAPPNFGLTATSVASHK